MKIYLQDFVIPKSAKFYKLTKTLQPETIKRCFNELSKEKLGYFLNHEIKINTTTPSGKKATVSSACFKINNDISFIKNKKNKRNKTRLHYNDRV